MVQSPCMRTMHILAWHAEISFLLDVVVIFGLTVAAGDSMWLSIMSASIFLEFSLMYARMLLVSSHLKKLSCPIVVSTELP